MSRKSYVRHFFFSFFFLGGALSVDSITLHTEVLSSSVDSLILSSVGSVTLGTGVSSSSVDDQTLFTRCLSQLLTTFHP